MTKKVWASVLVVIGLATWFGLFDTAVRLWTRFDLGIDIRQYATPHADHNPQYVSGDRAVLFAS